MSPLCIRSLPDLFVDCLLLFFSLGFVTCFLICLQLLMNGFSYLIFIYKDFLLFVPPRNVTRSLGQAAIPFTGNGFFHGLFQSAIDFFIVDSHFNHILIINSY